MSVAVSCMFCSASLLAGKRYRITEEYPRATMGYICEKCWLAVLKVSAIYAGVF